MDVGNHEVRGQKGAALHRGFHRFAALLEDLEASKGELGIDSYGLTVTTLEEVFLAVSAAAAAAGAKTGAAPPLDGTGPQVALDMQPVEASKAAAALLNASSEQQGLLNTVPRWLSPMQCTFVVLKMHFVEPSPAGFIFKEACSVHCPVLRIQHSF